MIARIAYLFDWLMALGTFASAATMFGVVLASSTSRYLFDAPFIWSEELARYAMIYGTMFGSVMALSRTQHMRFTILADLAGGRAGRWLGYLTDAATIAIGAILLWSGWLFTAARGGLPSTGLGIATGWADAALPVGGACLIVAAALDIAARRRGTEIRVVAL